MSMKSKAFLQEIKDLDQGKLHEKAASLAQELMKLRFRNASGQLEHGHRIRETKRNLARVLGKLNSQKTQTAAKG